MAIDFPNSPTVNDTHTSARVTWKWDGTTWKAEGVTSSYSLPTAATNTKGGIKIGSGLTMTGETLSADASAITVQEEGSSLSTAATTLNFVGPNVTASGTGAVKTITVSDASGVTVQEEGSSLATAGTTLNFVGSNVTATGTGATKTITITGGGNAAPEITWVLGAGTNSYTFNGLGFPTTPPSNPTLYLIRGQTYKFENNTGGHPFRIQSTVAQAGGGTAYNTGVTNQDAGNGVTLTFVVPMDAPNTLYYQCTAHPNMTGTINVITQGATSLASRQVVNYIATNLTFNTGDTQNFAMGGAKSYALLKIKPQVAGWVTFYVTEQARTADVNRVQGADPAPDSGVIAEVITTTTNEEITMSPGVLGWHEDAGNDAVSTIFVRYKNLGGNTSNWSLEATIVRLED